MPLIISISFYSWHFSGTNFTSDISLWGSFGDYLSGTIGIVFSILTIILIFITYERQSKHMRQVETHMKKTEDAFNKQLKVQKSVNVYTNLFNFLDRKDKLKNNIKYLPIDKRSGTKEEKNSNLLLGDDAITEMLNEARSLLSNSDSSPTDLEKFQSRGETLLKSVDYIVPFVNLLYNIILFIDTSVLSKNEKTNLMDFVRNSLQANEIFLYMIFTNKPERYNSPDLEPTDHMYRLAKENGFFEFINQENIDLMIVN